MSQSAKAILLIVVGYLGLTVTALFWLNSGLTQQHRDASDDVAKESDRLCAEQREILVAAIQADGSLQGELDRTGNSLSANFIRLYANDFPYVVRGGWWSKLFENEDEAYEYYKRERDACLVANHYFRDESSETGWSLEFTEWHDGRLKAEMFSFQGEARVFPSLSAFEARFGSLEYLLARSVPE